MNTANQVSTDAREIESGGSTVPMNLYETTTLSFRGETPLIGFKMIKSRAFWGGIGAEVSESFEVTEMDMTQDTFFASARHTLVPDAHEMPDPHSVFDRIKAGPGDLVGIQVKNSFNGTWTTDATWHKLLEKDIKHHKSFTGSFEVEDTLKFHENRAPERGLHPCGIDC